MTRPLAEQASENLRLMSRAGDLAAGKRLAAKIPMSGDAALRRLRTQSRLRRTCLSWQRLGASIGSEDGASR